MKEYVGKVVSIVTVVGDLVGELESITKDMLKIKNPRLIIRGDDNELQMMPTVSASAEQYPESGFVHSSSFACINLANESVVRIWQKSDKENSSVEEIQMSPTKIQDVEEKTAPRPSRILKSRKTKVIDIDV